MYCPEPCWTVLVEEPCLLQRSSTHFTGHEQTKEPSAGFRRSQRCGFMSRLRCRLRDSKNFHNVAEHGRASLSSVLWHNTGSFDLSSQKTPSPVGLPVTSKCWNCPLSHKLKKWVHGSYCSTVEYRHIGGWSPENFRTESSLEDWSEDDFQDLLI